MNSKPVISHLPTENGKASMDNAKYLETLKVKTGARKYKKCLIISFRKGLEVVCTIRSTFCLMTGALYRTIPPNNPCML